jgi:hypothetical protein
MTTQKLWCCVSPNGEENYKSLADSKVESIFSHTSPYSDRTPAGYWNYWESDGWRCVKVEVTIKEIKEVKP